MTIFVRSLLFLTFFAALPVARAAGLPDLVAEVKPSVVAVGTVQLTRNPPYRFLGTGFAVGNGRWVVTNKHVVPEALNHREKETLAVFIGTGRRVEPRTAKLLQMDEAHDLALLEIRGEPLPVLDLGRSAHVREGQDIVITGYPIGMVLGLYPVTHQGIVAAISPVAIPSAGGRGLSAKVVRALRDPYNVFQLDITAYPGNSGSPVYAKDTGQVIGVVNSVLVKGTKESALQTPTGITYAIPVEFVHALIRRAGGS